MAGASDKLVWIDLEMTGLEPQDCFILEIASLITYADLEIVAEGPNLVVHNSEEQLKSLSEWSRNQFGPSGLLDRVRASDVSLAEAEARTLDFVKQHVDVRASPLCGNSVHNDRAFLHRHMRELHDFLHYRNVDVSTIKELVHRWYPGQVIPPPKSDSHQALADIHESVAELGYYRDTFFLPLPGAEQGVG